MVNSLNLKCNNKHIYFPCIITKFWLLKPQMITHFEFQFIQFCVQLINSFENIYICWKYLDNMIVHPNSTNLTFIALILHNNEWFVINFTSDIPQHHSKSSISIDKFYTILMAFSILSLSFIFSSAIIGTVSRKYLSLRISKLNLLDKIFLIMKLEVL